MRSSLPLSVHLDFLFWQANIRTYALLFSGRSDPECLRQVFQLVRLQAFLLDECSRLEGGSWDR